MKKQDFYFDLPPELIAQYPLENRSDSRLLVHHRSSKTTAHHQFNDLVDFFQAGDLLVMNNSQVIKARLYGKKASGGQVELLVERIKSDHLFLSHIKASKAPKPGTIIHLTQDWQIKVLRKVDDLYECEAFDKIDTILETIGHIPLPHYLNREDEISDLTRYQTVYAAIKGSVAAPTAGLHFDQCLLQKLIQKGVHIEYLTLHVGAGTFRPVRTENIKDHKMHKEFFSISENLANRINVTREAKKRVIAVGTTSLRSLESAAQQGNIQSGNRETDIFIYPGYQFQVCDGLITNFHLPESTLLMLVSAFIGHAETMELYQEAIKKRYRFFSYGDASLLL